MIRRPVQTSAGLAAAVLALAALASVALGAPATKPTAVVSMGDSYISGEAGRWAGNSITPAGDKDGTDRACRPAGIVCAVDKSKVYLGGSDVNGCHRSDTAEILTASVPVAERVNISCSGAQTRNIFRASKGGQGQNGEATQADQLRTVAATKNVKLIMLSIGGNDLGFAGIVAACLQAYTAKQGPCEPRQQPGIDAKIAKATADVGKAIDEIRVVMAEAGYGGNDYRLVVQTYPSVVPRASEARYAEQSSDRNLYGCPFYDRDLDWARERAAPQIGTVSKTAAASRGVEALDLKDALQGHEICSKSAAPSTPTARPSAAGAEWGRVLSASTVEQGDLQEAFHPNAYAQRALGTCITKLYPQSLGTFACTGAAGIDPSGMVLTRTGSINRAGCLARRSPLGRRNIGRIRLGLTQARLLASPRLAQVAAPASTKRVRYCVKSSKGRVTAVFGAGTRVALVTTTAGGHGIRRVRPGSSLARARRAFPRMRRIAAGVYRTSARGSRLIGVRRGKVRYFAVAGGKVLKSKRLLRLYLSRAGL